MWRRLRQRLSEEMCSVLTFADNARIVTQIKVKEVRRGDLLSSGVTSG